VRLWDPALLAENMSASYGEGINFWIMFALFFPAVTGIMAGANMSGDLRDPSRAIPLGTIGAILFTGVVYILFAILLGGSSTRASLTGSSLVVAKVAILPSLIMAGVFAATLSSALGSMMGAPRILQALARDRVLPILLPFAKGSGASNEPRRATILSFGIAQACILLGDLNAIAPVITMFFMITYGAINMATFSEAFSGNPSFRPTFRWCHWTLSLAGALLCAAVMLLISPVGAIVATLVMVALYRYLQQQQLEANWGDVGSGTLFERARRNLLTLQQEPYHKKNWRPSVLAMGSDVILRMGRDLAGSHGVLFMGQVFTGKPEELLERHATAERALRKTSQEQRLDGFPAVTIAPTLAEGISSLVQCCGLGALRPNTVLFGWNTNPESRPRFLGNLRSVVKLGRSLAVLRDLAPEEVVEWDGTIDVWWQGRGPNGHLMLLLAHILTSNPQHEGLTIRLIQMIPSEEGRAGTLEHLKTLIQEVRIDCEPVVVCGSDFAAALSHESRGAALVMLGMADPCTSEDDFLERLDSLAGDVPQVLFVHSAGDMSLRA
jgi:hypothetical protein